jgi:hypothetical protein
MFGSIVRRGFPTLAVVLAVALVSGCGGGGGDTTGASGATQAERPAEGGSTPGGGVGEAGGASAGKTGKAAEDGSAGRAAEERSGGVSGGGPNAGGAKSDEGPEAPGSGSGGKAGGGESGEGGATGSKAAFIAKADAICKKAQARTSKEFSNRSEVPKGSSEASYAEKLITTVIAPRLQDRISGIRALPTPSSAQQAAHTVVTGFERLRKAALANPGRFQQTVTAMLPKLQKAARKQGFGPCAGYLG